MLATRPLDLLDPVRALFLASLPISRLTFLVRAAEGPIGAAGKNGFDGKDGAAGSEGKSES